MSNQGDLLVASCGSEHSACAFVVYTSPLIIKAFTRYICAETILSITVLHPLFVFGLGRMQVFF